MHPDLQRLIQLQSVQSSSETARRQIAEVPIRIEQLRLRLDERSAAVVAARERLTESQTQRRTLEKDVAAAQARLSKFKDQLMEVKTNKEYQAMQKEIATADRDVRSLEDRILEHMLESDELTGDVKRAEAELATEEKAVKEEEAAIERERAATADRLEQFSAERAQILAGLDSRLSALFDHIAQYQRRGVAVVEAKAGMCTYCHVRLRPQIFNTVRRNDDIIQCDSCHRILYFVQDAAAGGAAPA